MYTGFEISKMNIRIPALDEAVDYASATPIDQRPKVDDVFSASTFEGASEGALEIYSHMMG